MLLSEPRQMGASRPATEVRFTVQNGPLAARTLLDHLHTTLAPLGHRAEDVDVVNLVLAEIVNNIVEHAYGEGVTDKPIVLLCLPDRDGLRFEITDRGRPMPGGVLPTGRPAKLDVDLMDLPEGGFGWALIHDLAEDLQYQRVGDTNRMTFRVPLGS